MQKKSPNATTAMLNRQGAYCALAIIIQQITVASSTFFIIRLIESTVTPQTGLSISYLLLFVGSLIVVYIPTALSHIYLDKFRLDSISRYISFFVSKNRNRPLLAHKRYKDKYESWITNESPQVYQEATLLAYECFSNLLNSSLSILVIGAMLDSRLIGWYAAAGFILFISNRIFRKRIEESSEKVQNSRQYLSSVLLGAWENVFIGNPANIRLWSGDFRNAITKARQATISDNLIRAIISSLTVALAIGIVASGIGMYLSEHINNITAISAMIVTLPRQIQIIQSVFMFFNHLLDIQGIRIRLRGLNKPLEITQDIDKIKKYIHIKEMEIVQKGHGKIQCPNIDDLNDHISNFCHGRLTIRGPNGVGKSTLIGLLAEKFKEESIYLPSKSGELLFHAKSEYFDGSDGQRTMAVLQKIASSEIDNTVLFLDEWDAHLDGDNISKINHILDQIAQERIVVEVRHRH